jgi:hypothetical protein
MHVAINDPCFLMMASELNTSPNKLAKALMKHAGRMSIYARNDVITGGRSLDDVLTDIFENALPGLLLNSLIKEIVGEHDYVIDDGGFSREKGIIWVDVSFLKGAVLNMGSIALQFGKDSGIVALEYMKAKIDGDLDEIAREIEYAIDDKDPTFDLDRFDSIELEDTGDGTVAIALQINWTDMLDLPRIAEIDMIMSEIKRMLHTYTKKGKQNKKLT